MHLGAAPGMTCVSSTLPVCSSAAALIWWPPDDHAVFPAAWVCCLIRKHLGGARHDLFSSMLPVYKELLAVEPPLSMLVFSGDVDGIVPVLGTRRWIRSLALPVTRPWRPWTSSTGAAARVCRWCGTEKLL